MGRASSAPPSRNNTNQSTISSSSPSGAPFSKPRAATSHSKTSPPAIIRTSDMSSSLHPSCLLALIKKLFGQSQRIPEISPPTGFVHVKHVGFDGATGEFIGDQLSTLTEMLSAPVQPPPEAIRSANDISRPDPEEVKHITHVTYDEKVGFKNVPEEWRAILLAQGVPIADDA